MWSPVVWAIPLLAGQAAAWTTSREAEVKKSLAEDERTLIAFVVPDAEASTTLLPEWEAVQHTGTTRLAIDCTRDAELCREFDVVSFPTIRLYRRDGAMVRYRGDRRATAIVSFVERILRPMMTNVSGDDLASFSTIDDIVFIASLGEEKELLGWYTETAEKLHDRYTFGLVSGAQPPAQFRCHNHIEETELSISDLNLVDPLREFVSACTEPLIQELTSKRNLKLTRHEKYLAYYFSNDRAELNKYRIRMMSVAQRFKDHEPGIVLVTFNSDEWPTSGLGISGKVGFAMYDLSTKLAYPYAGELVPDIVGDFIQSVVDNKVQPWDGKHEGQESSYQSTEPEATAGSSEAEVTAGSSEAEPTAASSESATTDGSDSRDEL
ncbi:hypothetical protein RJ55_05613 [Drechmeria coniospora]|nr:hypothetical protein RJ55_05613 [Drechmeria coniospora]